MKPTQSSDTIQASNPAPGKGAPEAHPVGTGKHAAAFGASGAVVESSIGGTNGGVVGATVGSIDGGFAGNGVAEAIDPTVEDAYWEQHHRVEEYYDGSFGFQDYLPAYRIGYGAYPEFIKLGRSFESAEDDLKSEFEKSKGSSRLDWEHAKVASKAAWDRVHRRTETNEVIELPQGESEMPTSPPASADHLEQLAADIASQDGHDRVTDQDRTTAYGELKKISPTVSPDEPPSH